MGQCYRSDYEVKCFDTLTGSFWQIYGYRIARNTKVIEWKGLELSQKRSSTLYPCLTATFKGAELEFGLVAGAASISFFGVSGLQMFMKDMAFSAVALFSTILAVLISARQLPEEVQRRTIYLLLARPVSRWQMLLAKFLAAWVCSIMVYSILTAAAVLLLLILRIHIGPIFFNTSFCAASHSPGCAGSRCSSRPWYPAAPRRPWVFCCVSGRLRSAEHLRPWAALRAA